jgi:hypothetical protein
MCSIGYGEVCLVILADINVKGLCEEGLRSTAEFGVKESETIHWMPFPVTAEMVAGVIVGKIDVLVGNAGVDSIVNAERQRTIPGSRRSHKRTVSIRASKTTGYLRSLSRPMRAM